MKIALYIFVSIFIASCGGGSGNGLGSAGENSTPSVLSNGLKIFVTPESHVGDFANDPTLIGVTGIDKADDFCAKSSGRPNNSTYKALIVDGVNRDALSLTNWVLQPNTTYFRPINNVQIGTTTNLAIFPTFITPLTNSIADAQQTPPELGYVWTGIGNVSNFAAGNSCNLWSDSTPNFSGVLGIYYAKDVAAFHPINITGSSCFGQLQVYCVEQ